MAHKHLTPEPVSLEDALTTLFCLVDDAYPHINPRARHYASLKRLSDSEVITLALLQQLRGVESCRSFLRDAERFLYELFPGVVERGGSLPFLVSPTDKEAWTLSRTSETQCAR